MPGEVSAVPLGYINAPSDGLIDQKPLEGAWSHLLPSPEPSPNLVNCSSRIAPNQARRTVSQSIMAPSVPDTGNSSSGQNETASKTYPVESMLRSVLGANQARIYYSACVGVEERKRLGCALKCKSSSSFQDVIQPPKYLSGFLKFSVPDNLLENLTIGY